MGKWICWAGYQMFPNWKWKADEVALMKKIHILYSLNNNQIKSLENVGCVSQDATSTSFHWILHPLFLGEDKVASPPLPPCHLTHHQHPAALKSDMMVLILTDVHAVSIHPITSWSVASAVKLCCLSHKRHKIVLNLGWRNFIRPSGMKAGTLWFVWRTLACSLAGHCMFFKKPSGPLELCARSSSLLHPSTNSLWLGQQWGKYAVKRNFSWPVITTLYSGSSLTNV